MRCDEGERLSVSMTWEVGRQRGMEGEEEGLLDDGIRKRR